MQIIGKRLAVAAALWLMLCAMVLAAALPAAGEVMEEPEPLDIHIFSAWAEEKDGIVTVTAQYCTDYTYAPGDALWLTVSCGGQRKAIAMNANRREDFSTVTLSGCLEPDLLQMEVRGFRRDWDGSLYPVHGEDFAPVNGDRILKMQLAAGDCWDFYLVGELWELFCGYLVLSNTPTREELETYAVTGNLVTTWTSEEEGEVSWNLTENGCPDGVYLLVERQSGRVCYVTVPKVDAYGDVLGYIVNVSDR